MQDRARATSVRLRPEKLAELDAVAGAMARDRSYVINEAIDAYLAVHRWQTQHVGLGLDQADAGHFADDDEVDAAYARWA